jgi:ubiquinone/menaquinone biosynthesis C-methylase UbiE
VAQSKPNEEVEKLYTARLNTYRACISFFRSREGIRALLESSEFLRPGLRALDAGAGFGTATFALLDALRQRRIEPSVIDAFDLTPAMLEQFQAELDARGVSQVRLKQGNVLTLWQFPPSWSDYNLIVSASMLEYLAKADLSQALSGLRGRLVANGTLLAVVTRKNWITKILIEWWWQAATYTRQELREAFAGSGFHDLVFIKFPLRYFWLNISNYVVVARCAG